MVLHRWFSIDRDEKTFLSRDITFTLGVILTTRSAQKILEGGKKKPEETESVLSKINELITLAVEKGRGPTAVTGHRYSEYLKGLENSGEAERRRKRPKDEIPVLVKKPMKTSRTKERSCSGSDNRGSAKGNLFAHCGTR